MSMEQSVESLQEALADRFPGDDVVLSLTATGERIVSRLGVEWLCCGVAPLRVDDPERPVELVLGISDREPLEPGGWVQPGTSGQMYLGEGAVGRLSLSPRSGEHGEVVKRILRMPSEAVLDGHGEVAFGSANGRIRRALISGYGKVYDRAPVLLDVWKQTRNVRRDPLARGGWRGLSPMTSGRAVDLTDVPPTVWIAMHWLEPGGAEVWALDSAQIAREQGFRVVITVDRPAPQRWLDRALAITEHVYLAASVLDENDWGRFERGIVERYAPSVLHIHHSQRAYDFLPELKHLHPSTRVIDSTHIVENRTGGFVRPSIEYTALIDLHHVISPELRDLYRFDAHIPESKVRYRPLTDVVEDVELPVPTPRGDGPLRVGFLGRIAAQKRPFLFVELVRRLHRSAPGRFRFIMQGSGPLDGYLGSQIARSGLSNVIERREWGPAKDFFADVDVLVISSDCEGLTLVGLEADASGVLVLSADVGSQATIVPCESLLPRQPRAFLSAAQQVLGRLGSDREAFGAALAHQHALVQSLREHQPAKVFLREYLSSLTGGVS